ncbi:MAG: flagellar export chaperone FliS [Gammaproteobacteria bacterium]|nr:flagellar export chaperone FliS [Gammaproteobacteria bacterium]MBT8436473.1 flagellar export chaperone FliS [Gammaproteobacteria bacterium]
MTNVALKAVNQYQSADNSSIAYADPHELILRLMNGAMERIAQARGAIERNETAQKGEFIGKAISIIGGLEGCLDHSQQGELSGNLSDLYQYMIIALTEANMSDDIARLNEISDLLLTIKSAWEQIPDSAKETGA